jgi:cell division protein FtsI/penicillin-binding protein 2
MRGIVDQNGHTPAALRLAGEPSPDMPVIDERWKVPPSLGVMLQPLEPLHRPTGSLYAAYTAAPPESRGLPAGDRQGVNQIDIGGAPVDIGFSIDLTIDPSLQMLAQQTAACYTGRHDVCGVLGIRRKEDGSQAVGHLLLERAMVRMAAVAVIDVASGRIEALAGALSPCTREEYDGPGRSTRCDQRLTFPIRYRPDALLNPAVFHDAMPGSIIKPIMAAAFLSNRTVGPSWLSAERAELARAPTAIPSAESMRGQLARSNSARFLDRMFCADKNFAPCERPWEIQKTALAFGWNAGCEVASEQCGKRDLLFGRTFDARGNDGFARPLALAVPYGRLLVEPTGGVLGAPFQMRAAKPLDTAKVRQCAAGPDGQRASKDDWERCSGALVVDVVAEGWGQGHARASALGAAGMMAMLAAAANGQTRVPKPHLVQDLRGTGPADSSAIRWSLADTEPNPIARDAAEVIINGLSFSHRAGTARLACEQVFDMRTCVQMDWIAGKTGTPTFPNDDRSLDELARLCAQADAKARRDRGACGPLRPYKWYVAAYRTDPADPRWDKVIGVLTERNWLAESGRIHGAGDRGPNPAAEIAMQIAGRHVGVLGNGPRGNDAVLARGTK